jgi:rfaE bifunctional protein nucleotidyltransferase chain/domain
VITTSSGTKIVERDAVPRLADRLASAGLRVGLCHGCFDIVHAGHVHHFEQAARDVDVLVVSVTPARFIDKGPGRPVFDDAARVSVLAALGVVDHVVLNNAPTAAGLIRALRPHTFFKGPDYQDTSDPRIADEQAALREVGGRHVVTDARVTDSSTRAASALLAEVF